MVWTGIKLQYYPNRMTSESVLAYAALAKERMAVRASKKRASSALEDKHWNDGSFLLGSITERISKCLKNRSK